MPAIDRPVQRLFQRLTAREESQLLATLREERTGGFLLLLGAVVALVWANSPWASTYDELLGTVVGPSALHLDLTVAAWATDGLLAIFFFVVGLELKREFVDGELRRFSTAVVPAVAAVGGMIVPALLYLTVNLASSGGSARGWAIPTATDIAFAVAVLSVVGRNLPNALRAFLLTLAVVDDLLAIIVIAVFFTDELNLVALAAALLCTLAFGLAVRRRGWRSPAVLIPLALLTWGFMHASGVHATIAGVLLALTVPAVAGPGQPSSDAERFEHRWRPVSAGFAVPVFALCAAGVSLSAAAIAGTVADPVAQGVALGLVVGKPLGIVLATWLVARFTHATLAAELGWGDVVAVGLVGGIGFTVSLLIGELAFGDGTPHGEHLKVAILGASLLAALIGGTALALRDRYHARPAPTSVDPAEPTAPNR
ncbi:Na+/H+ antiporter NhaA [Cellulomonas sp. P22]|uniref:Na+/H+ antiporter NhaA n=1 Tax=Cellulomonas sp. P22 TaxID=3373189 RepID=UPI0037B05D25